MSWIEISFWISVIILLYVYFGYGFIVYLLIIIKRMAKIKTTNKAIIFEPAITLIIPCFAEAHIIATKITNCKQLNYPKDKLKIILITDEAADISEFILNSWHHIKVFQQPKHVGKTAALNRVIKFADTPFVIFSDANTTINIDAVKKIIQHFANSMVGCVAGEKNFFRSGTDSANSAGDYFKWQYERLLKRMDSELNTSVGISGELVAYKTELYKSLPADTVLPHFIQSMLIAASGYKVVYEPSSHAQQISSENIHKSLDRKVQICAGEWQSVIRLIRKLSFFKHPILLFQYISNRLLRTTITPFLLILLFILNIKMDIYVKGIYQIFMGAQFVFYTLAMVGLLLKNTNLKYKYLFVPYYFCILNYAVLAGLIKYLTGSQTVNWNRQIRKTIVLE